MIDAHELTEDIWARYNSRYNNSGLYSEEETRMAKMVLEDVQSAINFYDRNMEYRWHDLRKDPNDLPEEIGRKYIITQCGTNKYIIAEWTGHYFGEWGRTFSDEGFILQPFACVDRWKEIEPFEEVEE